MENPSKIGIHHNRGSASEKWILYCRRNSLPFKIVNCYESDIIEQLEDCYALLWHFHHNSIKDKLFAKQLLFSLEHAGKKVFPSFNTSWHFDDKVGQKYLLEAMGLPLVPSYIFYQESQALDWAKDTSYPKVFKLRNGAGSSNVRLVRNYRHALSLINRAFNKGFLPIDRWYRLREAIREFKWTSSSFKRCLKGAIRVVVPMKYVRTQKKEKGYIYFQDFIPNNTFDMRVIVVGDKAFAAKRMVRKNDFRASGSGVFNFNRQVINIDAVRMAFEAVRKLKTQCLAFDFVFDERKQPLIVEISYAFCTVYDHCDGYWNKDLEWINENFSPQELMIESVLKDNTPLKQLVVI